MNASPELLSIIVPVYNRVATIRRVLDRLVEVSLPVDREILVIDDGSTDGTREALNAALDDGLGVEVIEASRHGGKGSAIRLGLTQAHGTIIAILDADLALDPRQISTLVGPIVRGEAVAVYGSRFLGASSGAPAMTIAANRVLTSATGLLFGAVLTDTESCYKVMRTDVARSLRLTASGFDIDSQITARLLRQGHRIHELPVPFEPRPAQGIKGGWRAGLRALQVLMAERFRRV